MGLVDPGRWQYRVGGLADATTQCGSRGSSWMNTTLLGAEALVQGMVALAYEAELATLVQSQRHQLVAGTVVG